MGADRLMCQRAVAVCGFAMILVVGAPAPRAEASLSGALSDLIGAVLSLPAGVLSGTLRGPLVVGTVAGALQGAFNTVGYTARGALQLVGVAIPLALKLAPYVPLIL